MFPLTGQDWQILRLFWNWESYRLSVALFKSITPTNALLYSVSEAGRALDCC